MTLKIQYERIMDEIEVTGEMQERILRNLQGLELQDPHRRTWFAKNRKSLSIAACFAVLIAGVVGAATLPNSFRQPSQPDPPVQVTSDIVRYSSPQELAKAVNFAVTVIEPLPFEVNEIRYIAYWQKVAQIIYSGSDQTLVFRKSLGSQDNSGDFNSYDTLVQHDVEATQVTLKGNAGGFQLALWTDGHFSYSIRVSAALPQSEILDLVSKVNSSTQ